MGQLWVLPATMTEGIFFCEKRFFSNVVWHAQPALAVMADMNRELRAMILAALPYPPLPVCAKRFEEGNRLGDGVVVTSHDIISHLLEAAVLMSNAHKNAERRERQKEVLRCFLRDLVQQQDMNDLRELYDIYCRHTREHIASEFLYCLSVFLIFGLVRDCVFRLAAYYPVGYMPELHFMPLSYVCKGDAVHRKICDYMAGQAVLLELSGGFSAGDWLPRQYHELLTAARDRLVTEANEDVLKASARVETLADGDTPVSEPEAACLVADEDPETHSHEAKTTTLSRTGAACKAAT
jgi:hypothetical protein